MNMQHFMQSRAMRLLAALCLTVMAGSASAQWELDNASSTLNFISIKNGSVAETHSFGSMFGYVGNDGAVQLSIDLDSVDTAIDIRDQRMRELLFETGDFPAANIKGQVAPAIIEALEPGSVVTSDLGVTLSLHGVEAEVTVPVLVISESGGMLRVISTRPVVVSASDFNLGGGVEALQKVAGLASISTAVPVSFHLVFKPAASTP